MLIWLDILTPKQLYFLVELGRRLETNGHDVFRTTRNYREVTELVKLRGVSALSVGKHGGASLEGKLAAGAQRIEGLSHVISKLKPDLSIAFASPEAARTAFGLAIPHYTINDSPHSTSVAKLTIPLASRLFAPSVIPPKVWMKLGASKEMMVQYNALDPIVWLKNFIPNPEVLYNLKLDNSKPIVVFRVEESFASYLLGHVQEGESVTIPIINKLMDAYDKSVQIVILPRYAEQISIIRAAFHNDVVVARDVVDGPSLLFFSSVFVGAGGTMTAEAAMLGTPAISCYPREPTIVERYLIGKKLISRSTDSEKTMKKIMEILDDFENVHKILQERARTFVSEMEDPVEVIMKVIENEFPRS
ncbi:MAG: Lipid-A-disaccharide synthase [Thermoproteota archaeon]|nr:Lipid-A-disaccharide synthase [Thermoproteota archaeon]